MKIFCKKCGHRCHCKGQGYYVSDSSCEAYCDCKTCCHTEEDLIIDLKEESIFKKIIRWFT